MNNKLVRSQSLSFKSNSLINLCDAKYLNILIVDDEPFNLVALEGLLGHLNIDKIDKALNGRDALDIIKKNTIAYDMVITDN
jgi:CheY-like chemotaxis protein